MVMRSTAGVIKTAYRDVFTKEFDVYDDEKTQASLKACSFCQIVVKSNEADVGVEIWYQDDKIVIFKDRRPCGKVHGLVIPKRHIRDIFHLRKGDLELLEYMQSKGLEILWEKKGVEPEDDVTVDDEQVALGFHVPPFNSVFHLHLHIVGLPLLEDKKSRNKVKRLMSVEDVKKMIENKA